MRTAPTRRDAAVLASAVFGRRPAHRPAAEDAPSGQSVRPRGVDLAQSGGPATSRRSPELSWRAASSRLMGMCAKFLPGHRARRSEEESLWLDQAGVRLALAVPLRG